MSTLSSSSDLSFFQVSKGIRSWIFTLDHKRIALLYFYSICTFFLVGVVLGLLMRLELIAPGKTIVEAHTYNQLFTLHGVIMIFLFIIYARPRLSNNSDRPVRRGYSRRLARACWAERSSLSIASVSVSSTASDSSS